MGPVVRLHWGMAAGRSLTHELTSPAYLIGTVPGCDFRIPAADLPPVVCLLTRDPSGVRLRKLVPTVPVRVNGQPPPAGSLQHGDRLRIGPVEGVLEIEPSPSTRTQPLSERGSDRSSLQEKLAIQAAELARQQQELSTTRQELAAIRRQLYERYRERRDRLAGLQAAVENAARKVQEEKRQLEAERRRLADAGADLASREAALAETHQTQTAQLAQALEQARHAEQVAAQRLADLELTERQLQERAAEVQRKQEQYAADLMRLDRRQAALEDRQQQLEATAAALAQREQEVAAREAELTAQAERWRQERQAAEAAAERLSDQRRQLEQTAQQQARRATELEGQQAQLAQLRARLERQGETLRAEQQELAAERERLERFDAAVREQAQLLEQLRGELEAGLEAVERERLQQAQRAAELDRAAAELQQGREMLAADEAEFAARLEAANAAALAQAEESTRLRAWASELAALQERLAADRQALREREEAQAQVERVREGLQEQLRRRSEELAERQRLAAEHQRRLEADRAALEVRAAEIERRLRQGEDRIAEQQRQLQARATAMDTAQAELVQREQALQEAREALAVERRQLEEARTAWEVDQRQAAEAADRQRAALEETTARLADLHRELPELEARGAAAVERLALAREQLRQSLTELHAYATQARVELEAVRADVREEAERLQGRQAALQEAREQHRLAVVAFRQQVIDWQGQLAELKRTLTQGEHRLDRRRAEVEEQAREVQAVSTRLARQAEALQGQERAVAERRQEIEQHLADMRDWYRRKLRELTLGDKQSASATADEAPADSPEPPAANILSLTGDVEPADQALGERLRDLGLVDADTLTALLVEARKQRRSLRQALLAGGLLTLYQLALIEAGNLDALMLGPVRVIDRLRVTARETLYRVFDPRRGREALLRHLGEAELEEAVRPQEYRQRFGQLAALVHPNLAATWEVLEIGGRPAVLQELVTGLLGPEWPSLVALPGVWYRLYHQVARGLQALHQAGLVHGRLTLAALVLTPEGVVKLCGAAEPAWLLTQPAAGPGASDGDDLVAMGRLAQALVERGEPAPRGRGKPWPAALRAVVECWQGDRPFTTIDQLVAALEALQAEVPASDDAWARLLRHVRDHAGPAGFLRYSA